jgi:hypothetical protein
MQSACQRCSSHAVSELASTALGADRGHPGVPAGTSVREVKDRIIITRRGEEGRNVAKVAAARYLPMLL